MPIYKFLNKTSGETENHFLTLQEYDDFKKNNTHLSRIFTPPRLKWNTTGGASNRGINDAAILKEKLASGMNDSEIEDLLESDVGQAVADQYINEQHKRGKVIASETNKLFTRELPNGNVSTDYVVSIEDKSGKITQV